MFFFFFYTYGIYYISLYTDVQRARAQTQVVTIVRAVGASPFTTAY